MADRAERPFEELLAEPLRNGLTRPTKDRGQGFKMVNMGELFAHPRIADVAMDRVAVSKSEGAKYFLRAGDLLFARQSLVLEGAGKCSVFLGSQEPVTFEGHLIRARIDRRIADPMFYYYYFKSSSGRTAIRSIVEQVAAAGIRGSDLAKLQVPWPSLSDQGAIAHILGILDDKIELNRRVNETLESLARTIFKSWFVDFDPVRSKAEGRDPGLPGSIAELFPHAFEDSKVGKIPKGWRVGTLAAYSELNPESWSRETAPDKVKYVDLANTKWGKIEVTQMYAWADAPSRAQRILRPGDTIVGTVRPGNGSYAFVTENGLTGSTGFAVLRPRKSEFREFVYLSSTIGENIEKLAHIADGGAYPAIRPDAVVSTQTICPPDDVVVHFAKATSCLLAKVALNDRESHTLADLRDTLLPKLISGELRVQDTEKIIRGYA